jgi:hypothetical protein
VFVGSSHAQGQRRAVFIDQQVNPTALLTSVYGISTRVFATQRCGAGFGVNRLSIPANLTFGRTTPFLASCWRRCPSLAKSENVRKLHHCKLQTSSCELPSIGSQSTGRAIYHSTRLDPPPEYGPVLAAAAELAEICSPFPKAGRALCCSRHSSILWHHSCSRRLLVGFGCWQLCYPAGASFLPVFQSADSLLNRLWLMWRLCAI